MVQVVLALPGALRRLVGHWRGDLRVPHAAAKRGGRATVQSMNTWSSDGIGGAAAAANLSFSLGRDGAPLSSSSLPNHNSGPLPLPPVSPGSNGSSEPPRSPPPLLPMRSSPTLSHSNSSVTYHPLTMTPYFMTEAKKETTPSPPAAPPRASLPPSRAHQPPQQQQRTGVAAGAGGGGGQEDEEEFDL